MLKALGSRIRINNVDTPQNDALSMDYFRMVSDLLYTKPVMALADWNQHKHISRLQHSVNVSYYSFRIARKLGLDDRSAARGGLLHDLFLFNWRELNIGARGHISIHPKVALVNAELVTTLNDVERDIIAKHMWPCGGRPKYKETLLVSFVDKFCALGEYFDYFKLYIKGLGCPNR